MTSTLQIPDSNAAALLGQWRLVSFDMEHRESGERKPAFGPGPKGRLILLPSAVMMVVVTAQGRPVPATDEERAAAFKTVIAYSGPFVVEGDQLKTSVDISWNEAWGNTVQIRYFKFIGANLSLTSAWAPGPAEPEQIVRGILEWEREDLR
jgi:Lipocalin-like domain